MHPLPANVLMAAGMLLAGLARAETATSRYELLPDPPRAQLAERQFLGLGEKDRVVLLVVDGEGFWQSQLLPEGRWSEAVRLGTEAVAASQVQAAALDRTGNWHVVVNDRVVRLSPRKSEELGDRAPLQVQDLVLAGSEIVLAVQSRFLTQRIVDPAARINGPDVALLRASDERWEVFLELSCRNCSGRSPGSGEVFRERTYRLASATAGGLWVVNPFLYEVYRISSQGRVRDRFRVSGGQGIKLPQAEIDRLRQKYADNRQNASGVRREVAILAPAVFGATQDPLGRLVLFVQDPHVRKPALDRYDETEGKLERVVLDGLVTVPSTLVATAEALYLAPRSAKWGQPLRVPWARLETGWVEVQEVELASRGDLSLRD